MNVSKDVLRHDPLSSVMNCYRHFAEAQICEAVPASELQHQFNSSEYSAVLVMMIHDRD